MKQHVRSVHGLASILGSVLLTAVGTVAAQNAGAPATLQTPAVTDNASATIPAANPEFGSEEWFKQVKNPTSWWSWGADIRLREKYMHLSQLSSYSPTHERHLERYRVRWWNTFTPVENLQINTRLMWEGRHYWQPSHYPQWYNGPAYADLLNIKLSKIMDQPVTLVFGRQEIKLNEGWLVLEGTPLDGSRTTYFDAARFTVGLSDATTLELIGIDQGGTSDYWIPTLGGPTEDQIEQNEKGAIVHLAHKYAKNCELDGYFIYKNDQANTGTFNPGVGGFPYTVATSGAVGGGETGDVYTFGARIAHEFDANWNARIEGAGQFGHKDGRDLRAFGMTSRLTYNFLDDLKGEAHLGYEYLSGDNKDSATNEGFDPLWGRWPQWSEYMVYAYAAETRVAYINNLHRVNLGYSCTPMENLNCSLDYHLLLTDENTMRGTAGFSNAGAIRGHLLALWLKYKFNAHMSGHLVTEGFFPGNYYTEAGSNRRDFAAFVRAEIVLTF